MRPAPAAQLPRRLALAVLLVGICAAVFTRRLVAKPLARLTEATRQVAEMKLDFKTAYELTPADAANRDR